jgi:hypothetical protein
MKNVAPSTGAPELAFASDPTVPEFIPITIAVYPFDSNATGLLTRWQLTPDERQRIAAGEDLYVMQLNYGTPMTPMKLSVGAEEFVK